MGTYITQADVEMQWGTENVRIWSNVDNDDAATDTDRVADAIETAEEDIENRFREGTVYTVPFVASGSDFPRVMKNWMATLAGFQLYQSRPSKGDAKSDVQDRIDAMDKEIAIYVKGGRRLALQRAGTRNPTCPTVVQRTDVQADQDRPGWGQQW